MSSKILVIIEGEKTEKQIIYSLNNLFFNNIIIEIAYKNVIYELYKKIKEDEFLDFLPTLQELLENSNLNKFTREDFSEIYLFFDHDGHSHLANDNKLKKMLEFFNNETQNGKLYISYPMVEALKHINDDFKNLVAKIKDNKKYKMRVNSEANNKYKSLKKYDKNLWKEITKLHCKKLNYVVNGSYEISKNDISQLELFNAQTKKYIKPHLSVSVIGAFGIFLKDYFGEKFIQI